MKHIKLPKILQPFHCNDLVRLGKNNDGGYLVHKGDSWSTYSILSFGVGTDLSFEKEFTTKWKNCPVTTFDESVDEDPTFHDHIRKHIKKNIDGYFFKAIVDKLDTGTFLKCDIDGAEYEIFDSLITHSSKFVGVVMEVHDIAVYENFNKLTDFISKFGLRLVHTHINNYSYYDNDGVITPNVLELTFTSQKHIRLNRDLRLPHELDMPCNPDGEDFTVSF